MRIPVLVELVDGGRVDGKNYIASNHIGDWSGVDKWCSGNFIRLKLADDATTRPFAVFTGDGLSLLITQMCWATLWPYAEVYSSLVMHNKVRSLFWF